MTDQTSKTPPLRHADKAAAEARTSPPGRPAPTVPPEGALPSSLLRVQATAAAGSAAPDTPPGPSSRRAGRDRGPRQEPDTPEPLSGEDWRRAAKKARSTRNAAQRRQATRYVRIADRPAGAQYKPGMSRRPPPGDDAA